MSDENRINIEMRCGCGALLVIDIPPKWVTDWHRMQELAMAWNTVHGRHHVEPKKGGERG